MKKILTYVTCFVVVVTTLCASMGVRPNIGLIAFRDASQHIAEASPTGNASAMSFIGYYFETAGNAWAIWEYYSSGGRFAVRVRIPDSPERYDGESAIYNAEVERKSASNPLDPWRKVAYVKIRMHSSQDSSEIRAIYDAMETGVFGLSSASPTAVASNIALKTAEVTATTQFSVWNACIDALAYVVGFRQTLD